MQNDLLKRINAKFGDFFMHVEMMKQCGFPAGEASRLAQFHAALQDKFEQLRYVKYYRTPQATRSFGRAYVICLPWWFGKFVQSNAILASKLI